MKIGESIKEYRKRLGLTQEELAQKSRISKNAVWNYENDKRMPTIDILKRIAEALNAPITNFVDDEALILMDVKEILDSNDFRRLIYPMNKKELVNHFRNILFNIGVIGLDPTCPSDEVLSAVVTGEDFKKHTKYLIDCANIETKKEGD